MRCERNEGQAGRRGAPRPGVPPSPTRGAPPALCPPQAEPVPGGSVHTGKQRALGESCRPLLLEDEPRGGTWWSGRSQRPWELVWARCGEVAGRLRPDRGHASPLSSSPAVTVGVPASPTLEHWFSPSAHLGWPPLVTRLDREPTSLPGSGAGVGWGVAARRNPFEFSRWSQGRRLPSVNRNSQSG